MKKSVFSPLPFAMITTAIVLPLVLNSCTTTKSGAQNTASGEVVSSSQTTPDGSQSNEDLPVELRDAQKFDPASTLDPKVVQESDFYQIKQSIEQNKAALDAEWKEQERMENSVKSAKSAEDQRKMETAKAEDEERERQRQKDIETYEKSKDQRTKDEQKTIDDAEKLPSIKNNEVNWKGLED
jgi:multimeric flavodoxin WrbA